ncbi:MAG: HAD family hydrolase [Desulfobacterales bacterium]|nr:HAD family hydrolase [Desulfobacterales bacterium]
MIFDCDGVLVDSEPISIRMLHETLNEVGLRISHERTSKDFEGLSDADCIRIIEERLGRPIPAEAVKEYEARLFTALTNELKPINHIHEALKAISTPTCVASSGTHDKMRATLSVTNLLPLFQGRIFSASEVARGKPHPDLFLHAAEKMGVPAESCVVVEDSIFGVQAGKAAGMVVLGYAERSDPAALAAAGAVVFKDMKALPRMIKEL